MSLRLNFIRTALSLVAASLFVFATADRLTAQVGGPDINPFEEDLGSLQETPAATEPEQKTGEELWADAQGLFDNGDYGEAMQIYNAFLSRNPNFGPAHLMLGKCLAAIGELELALNAFSNAATYAPQSAEPAIEKGNIYFELLDYKNAAVEFTKAVQADPFNADSLLQRGRAQLKLAQITQQSPSLLGGPNVAALVEQAISSLERAAAINPENAKAFSQLALARSFLGEMDEAIEDAQKAVAIAPTEPQYSARLGFVYKGRADNENNKQYKKDLSQAVADYSRSIAALTDFLKEKGDPNMDQTEFEENPDASSPQDVYLGRALAYVSLASITSEDSRNDYYQLAIEDCNKVLEFDIAPQNTAYALTERGMVQRLMGDTQTAIESYNLAIKAAGYYPDALLRRGIAYYHLNDLESALADFDEAMIQPSQPRDVRAKFWAGVVHARRGEFSDAIRYYTSVLRLNPGYKPAYNNRALAYLRTGRYQQAAKDFGILVRRDPSDSVSRARRDQALELMRNEMASNN